MAARSRCARIPAAALLLLGAGCGRRSADPYRETVALVKRGELKAALESADAGLRAEPSWRWRLLKAQILITGGQAVDAARFLASMPAPTDPENLARWRMYQGQADYMQSDLAGAETAIGQARSLAKDLGIPLLDAEIDMRTATLALSRGDPANPDLATADPLFRHALAVAAAHGNSYLAANAMGNLGVMYMRASRCDQGIYWLDRARGEFERLGSRVLYARTLGNLGVCYQHLGDYDQAIRAYREAEQGSRASGNLRDQQTWLGSIATTELEQGRYAEAAEGLRAALAIALQAGDKESAAWWLNNLTMASVNLGDLDAAERYNRQTAQLGVSEWSDYYRRLHEAEIAAARKDLDRAEKLFDAVLTHPSQDPAPVLDAEAGLAAVLIKTNRPDAAGAEFRKSMALIERQRSQLLREDYQLSYLASMMTTYQRYVDFLVTRGRDEQALEVAESSRARLLDEKLHATAAGATPLNASKIEGLARSSNSVLLSYWLGAERSFVWLITPEGVELHQLPPEKKIAALVESYRAFIETLRDPLDAEFPAARELSQILLGQVRDKLKPGARVLVVPDRSLNSLNFETLPDPENPSHYLIDRVTLSVAPSLALLAAAPRSYPKPSPSLLLIGNPEPAVEEYPRLPYAAQEVELIARNVPGRHKVFEGAAAHPLAYRAANPENFTWIHFAAHASANRENPLDSALILSRDATGYALSARQVMDVPLHASLVTLSACRSAGAKTYSGEGLVGLSWAFLRAGARNVVAGLWDVTDLSTARLMADFYSSLAQGSPPAEALREAKLHLVESKGAYRKPFYWGPFQLYAGAGL
jgi:CHAT domain-containing protein